MRRFLPLLGLVFALATAGPSIAQVQPWSGASVVEDPEWRKRFLGSYGVLSGAEPEIREDERLVLINVIDLIEVDPEAAAASLQTQMGENSSAALDMVMANLFFQNGQEEKAAEYYRSAIAKYPDFRRAHKNLGLLLVQKSDFEGALEHLTKAVELGDRDGRTYGLIGYCYINGEDYLAASAAYQNAILQQPHVKDWKIGLARSLLATERYQEAVALFDTLIEANPEDSTLWMLQANAYLGLDQPLAAAVNLEAVRMMGKAQNSSLVLLGDIYMNARMPELAKSAYLEVIEKDQGAVQFSTAYRAADLLIRSGSFDDAQQVLASIEKRYGAKLPAEDELKVLTLKAKVARAQGREAEAAELLETIVQRDGTRGDALLELAAYYRTQGDDERALLLVERAQNLDEYEYQALLTHAQYEVYAKDYSKAAELLRQALKIKQEPRVVSFLARVEGAIRPE